MPVTSQSHKHIGKILKYQSKWFKILEQMKLSAKVVKRHKCFTGCVWLHAMHPTTVHTMGGAAAMAHPKFWLDVPQCIWPHQ